MLNYFNIYSVIHFYTNYLLCIYSSSENSLSIYKKKNKIKKVISNKGYY